MGEIAEMMLDGTLCEGCGVYIEGDAEGIPRYCSDKCARDRGADWWFEQKAGWPTKKQRLHQKRPRPFKCGVCGRAFKSQYDLNHHNRDTGHA